MTGNRRSSDLSQAEAPRKINGHRLWPLGEGLTTCLGSNTFQRGGQWLISAGKQPSAVQQQQQYLRLTAGHSYLPLGTLPAPVPHCRALRLFQTSAGWEQPKALLSAGLEAAPYPTCGKSCKLLLNEKQALR